MNRLLEGLATLSEPTNLKIACSKSDSVCVCVYIHVYIYIFFSKRHNEASAAALQSSMNSKEMGRKILRRVSQPAKSAPRRCPYALWTSCLQVSVNAVGCTGASASTAHDAIALKKACAMHMQKDGGYSFKAVVFQ